MLQLCELSTWLRGFVITLMCHTRSLSAAARTAASHVIERKAPRELTDHVR